MSKENLPAKETISPELKSTAIELINELKMSLEEDREFRSQLTETFLYNPEALLQEFAVNVKYRKNGYEYSFTQDLPKHDNKIRFIRTLNRSGSYQSFEIDLKTLGRRRESPVITYSSRNVHGEIGDVNLSDSPEAIEKIHNFIVSLSSKHSKQNSI